MLPFGDGHTGRYAVGRILRTNRLGAGRRDVDIGDGLDVDEVEELHRVEPALTLAQLALLEQLSGSERELAANDAVVDARRALHFNPSDIGEPPGFRAVGDDVQPIGRPVAYRDLHFRTRVSVVLELVEHRLAAGLQQRPIERLARLERQPGLELVAMLFWNRVEARDHDPLDANRFAFLDVDAEAHGFLIVAETDVERTHARIRIAAIFVKGHDPLEVGLEFLAVEVLPRAPWAASDSRQLRGPT